jgi:hypothetical protein
MASQWIWIKPRAKWRTAVSHAPSCTWLAGWKRKMAGSVDDDYIQLPASSVPASVGRCSHCGGGR